ncbi:MAG: 30S ribosomal protein S2 [Chloroflexi bacterium]|nr:30S ribosomal protein S2 [Chloroflexota bacterium]
MPATVTMKQLLETGVHFGHRTTKWNPKMRPYIFTERNGIHIIDLQQTLLNLNTYSDMLRDIAMSKGTVLFVGTKRQAQEAIAREAERCGMPYVNKRWLGGTLTNWQTIRARIDTLKKLERRRDEGDFTRLSKKEALLLDRKIEKLQLRLGGLRDMRNLPEMMVVVDTRREATAVKEANTLKIPVMALADTNTNPDQIDYVIPANDDAVRAIKLLLSVLANAILEGEAMRKQEQYDEHEEAPEDTFLAAYGPEDDEDDDRYLGESTLAKLRESNLFDDENEDEG